MPIQGNCCENSLMLGRLVGMLTGREEAICKYFGWNYSCDASVHFIDTILWKVIERAEEANGK